VELELRQEGASIKKGPSLKSILQREIEGAFAAELKVSDRLTNPDPLVAEIKQDLAGKSLMALAGGWAWLPGHASFPEEGGIRIELKVAFVTR